MPEEAVIDSVKSAGFRKIIETAEKTNINKIKIAEKTVDVQKPFPSPVDWRDQWIYFLMVDRFNNPNKMLGSDWNLPCDEFRGGSINGIRDKLDYLKELGAGAIWISPIVKNRKDKKGTYHGYGFQDLLKVDPRFGTEKDLQNLVLEAHARGIYVILDIVLNHAGNVFAYNINGEAWNDVGWRDWEYPVYWRNAEGTANLEWSEAPENCERDAAVYPKELRRNDFFRRKGRTGKNIDEKHGDFWALKEMVTEYKETNEEEGEVYPVRNILIQAYQYLIAKYDFDGYRIDTLKYIEPEFALIFGNAMREFALNIGKKNFFTFGEVWDSEEKINQYIGKNTSATGQMIGVDAALDFPLSYRLPSMVKGFQTPKSVAEIFNKRKDVQKYLISSHGEASKYFITFLDNHDQNARFYYEDPNNPDFYNNQLTAALGLLFSIQGIPCVYYGTEQGLHGNGGNEFVREALWGKPNAFSKNNIFYKELKKISEVRKNHPALRYGRQYFRAISDTDAWNFGISTYSPGVFAMSRILSRKEILIVVNTQTTADWQGNVLIDYAINKRGDQWKLLYSNNSNATDPGVVMKYPAGRVVNGNVTAGPIKTIPISLSKMEIQIIENA